MAIVQTSIDNLYMYINGMFWSISCNLFLNIELTSVFIPDPTFHPVSEILIPSRMNPWPKSLL